ncbi:Phosphatidylethanolamine-binding protein homolog F40A3.3 [Geodia barretti]|uniref:Phosphatidylethanolamine-binding protein homolog F40A3.3 n=1 Tax=Geodia barretti TaxID=519541 RepID=A0AA35QV72_GEOBA|nr:Phosphatidylethanolamine-binding protein homolog F40A3.3 [Geodia barretti]
MALQEKFREHGVVPDVIDEPPAELAIVKYDCGVTVEPGAILTPTQVQNAPVVTWPAEDSALYTLIMTDPDAPSRSDPKWGEWRHWVVFNIPGADLAKGEEWWAYVWRWSSKRHWTASLHLPHLQAAQRQDHPHAA